MPAFSNTPTTPLRRRVAMVVAAAERAQETACMLRAKAEQHIIESECRATKLALTEDKEAWRAFRRRQRGKRGPAQTFVLFDMKGPG